MSLRLVPMLIYPVENPMELQWLANDLLTHNVESNRFAYFRTSKISFSSDDEVTWTLDGEFGDKNSNTISQAYDRYPLAVKLHLADLESTFLREKGTSAVNK